MKKAVLGLVLAAVVLAGAMILRGGADGTVSGAPRADHSATDAKGRQSPEVVLRISPGASGTPRATAYAAASRVSPLMREANSGGPSKPIYDRLIASTARTPEENYLLAEIIRICGQRDAVKAPPTKSDPAVMKYNEAQVRDLLDKGASGGDPKARARLIEKDIWAPLAGPDGNMRMGQDFKMPRITDAQLEGLREAAQAQLSRAIQTGDWSYFQFVRARPPTGMVFGFGQP